MSRPSPAPACRSSRRATGIPRTTARSASAGARGPRTAWRAARARASRRAWSFRPRPWSCRRTRGPTRTPTPGSRGATSTSACARPGRRFLIAAGLELALEYLETLRFTDAELEWVAREGRFDRAFVDYLARLRFTGDVHALPEGTVFFADEPILHVTAPLPEAQLVESRLVNLLHFQTLVASKAARAVLAAPGKLLVDFGMRRAHGAEAARLAARASYLAGLAGSATVLANLHFGIPIYGTMAHSFVQAHDDEAEAFAHFAADDPEHAVLLLDTYDTDAAAAKVVALAREGVAVRGVRLDSGDLAEHARRVRRILDAGGLREVTS